MNTIRPITKCVDDLLKLVRAFEKEGANIEKLAEKFYEEQSKYRRGF